VTGDSITAVVRQQLCGYALSPAMIEQAIREETFSAAIVNDRPVLSSERAPNINKPATD
jgi:hypothetical protein